MLEEEVNYIMQGPFLDALPNKCYSHKNIDTLKVHVRNRKINDGLYVDDIWPGAVMLADYLADRPELVADKTVLELGAGAALPSLVACRMRAAYVVISDFPDESIISNISAVLSENDIGLASATVVGYRWGDGSSVLLESLYRFSGVKRGERFQLILMAELLWRDTYHLHGALLRSAKSCLADNGTIYVSYVNRTPEDNLLICCDDFFLKASSEYGFSVSKVANYRRNDVCSCEIVDVYIMALTIADKSLTNKSSVI